GSDGLVRIWEPTTGRELRCGENYTEVWKLAFALGGKMFVTWSGKLTLLWDATLGLKSREFESCAGSDIRVAALLPDGKTLASLGCDDTLYLRDVTTGKDRGQWYKEKYGKRISLAEFSPDGRKLVLVYDDDFRKDRPDAEERQPSMSEVVIEDV